MNYAIIQNSNNTELDTLSAVLYSVNANEFSKQQKDYNKRTITLSLVSDTTDFFYSFEHENTYQLMLLSEESLKKDWLDPNEDLAWKDL